VVVPPEERLTPLPLERVAPDKERAAEWTPVAGARVTAEERDVPPEREVTPEWPPDARRVVTPERRDELDLVADEAARLPADRLDIMLRPTVREAPPSARELPA